MDKTKRSPMAEFPVQIEFLIPAVLVAVAVVIGTIIYFVSKLNIRNVQRQEQGPGAVQPPVAADGRQEAAAEGRAPRAPRARAARQRMVRQAAREEPDLDMEEDVEQVQEEFDYETGKTKKMGAKKVRKLEMKAERQAQREHEAAEREDRKRREEILDQQRQQQTEKEEQEEKKREEEEEARKAEQERKEQDAYMLLKESFQVHEEGFEKVLTESESQNLLQEFIDYIKEKKVVLLEDLGVEFNMKTQDAIQRVQELQEQGLLTGVVDDRGKVIYVSREELEGVAKFMQQRGRVSIADLAEASNTLVFLNAESEAALSQPLQA